ncbi:Ubiquitin carboxyl-terminal hydrolase 1 [Grifola frondosa]|uniref:ubiquitinyl hydrolase 1 n=1 Tax=Grifola frondosa TaxID=5627 RepID=A0A1C7M0L7_GRIFR|nr:Ubiquitin carboxyl-terminal hydrolase 1 [Grifola frondosa]
MRFQDDLRYFIYRILYSPAFQQVAPLAVIFLIPALVLLIQSRRRTLSATLFMVLEYLTLALPWNWSDTRSTSSSSSERRKSRKKHIRTRADQLARSGATHEAADDGVDDEGYYPGLVNISGTYCFMNSTLQATASLSYLQPHIEAIHAKAVVLDIPTPVIDALRDLLKELNTPTSSYHAIRPIDIISALSSHSSGKHNSLFSSREHQDAQELFQLLSECIKNEASAVDKEGLRDRGLGGLGAIQGQSSREIGKTVFDGLTANRRSCVECGYTEAVMHFAFDNWQLAVPRLVSACRLEDCLNDYTRLEILNDCICRKCSMLATYSRLSQEAEKLTEAAQASHDPSSSKKKRARDARKLLTRIKTAIDEGRIEEDIKGVKMEKVFSKASTKQAMIARPPPVLALHLNRSMHHGHYATKNTCRVLFPEILDLTPYTTSGQLSTAPSAPISTPPPPLQRCTTLHHPYSPPRARSTASQQSCVTTASTPSGTMSASVASRAPSLRAPAASPHHGSHARSAASANAVSGWGPDDSVREVGLESVQQEGAGAFMLYYERVVLPRAGVYLSNTPRSSEETVRPEGVHPNGSCASLASAGAAEKGLEKAASRVLGPRIVRSVSAHRERIRGLSTSPPDGLSTSLPTSTPSIFASSGKPLPNGDAHHASSSDIANGVAELRSP